MTYHVVDGTLMEEVRSDSKTLTYLLDENGTKYGVIYNGTYYYYMFNLQGDVIGIYDGSGNIVARYVYDVWGKLLAVTDNSGNAITSTTHIANVNPIRYRGYYYDVETGFYYLQSRYYDPTVGRFLNADALVSTGQGLLAHNMFAYCGNNPVNRVDPYGYAYIQEAGGGGGGGLLVIILSELLKSQASSPDTNIDIQNMADDLARGDYLGFGLDAIGFLLPGITGLGKFDEAADAIKSTKKGWTIGDDINALTKAGTEAKWSTVRQRYWKNEALFNPLGYRDDLYRMKKGLAPLHPTLNVSMELHHKIPRRLGGSNAFSNLQKVWPWQHAEIDPFRYIK